MNLTAMLRALETEPEESDSSEKGVEQSSLEEYRNKAEELKELVGKMKTELDEKTAALENVPTCAICFEKPPQCLFFPCSHMVCCESCGHTCEECPVCRQKISGKMNVYQ
ncbi:unnamed protein product [Enterobius vermicularis]|uniref:RING-type domain-containing protein n=1 Tax=Enterobius vermicularis TaxID=51028 RepID=A0A0N4VQ46_ENTVE|nr:unnamed protein product [Enterobius vermicularis]